MNEIKLIVIGASLGGLKAIQSILSALPVSFSPMIVIVQHRKSDDSIMVELLKKHCELPVTEVEDKMLFQPGQVFLAPPDYHLLVERNHFSLSTDAPVKFARPSIDVLFESIADTFGNRVIAILLTGANEDGVAGMAAVHASGGLTIAQDPDTAEAPTMPQSAIDVGVVKQVLSINGIRDFLKQI